MTPSVFKNAVSTKTENSIPSNRTTVTLGRTPVHRATSWCSPSFFWMTIAPLAFLIGGTIIIEIANLDLKVSSFFFDSAIDRFPLKNAEPWFTLSNLGCYPGLVLGVAGLAAGLIGCVVPRLRSMARPGLILGGILLIGPGVLVNILVKDLWGRPRPEQTVVFGGDMQYRPLYQPGTTDLGAHSFPCGHASIGFYLMAPAFVFWRTRPRLSAAFLALGMTMGLFIGYCRMIQGSHFLSDVLWSAGIVYFTGLMFHYSFGEKPKISSYDGSNRPMSRIERRASIDFAIGKIQLPLSVARGELAAVHRVA